MRLISKIIGNQEKPVSSSETYIYDMTDGKNLNSYPYFVDSPFSANGVTFTVSDDGIVTVTGTASADTYYGIHSRVRTNKNSCILPNGSYIISGCPSGGSENTYCIQAMYSEKVTETPVNLGFDTGNGLNISLNGDYYSNDNVTLNLTIKISSGQVIGDEGITFKPMIRDATIADDTWVPYAMTNRELTKSIRLSYTMPPGAHQVYQPFSNADYSTLEWTYTATEDCVAIAATNNSDSTSGSTMYLLVYIDDILVYVTSQLFSSAPPNYAFNRFTTVSLAKGQTVRVRRESASGQYFSTQNGIYI